MVRVRSVGKHAHGFGTENKRRHTSHEDPRHSTQAGTESVCETEGRGARRVTTERRKNKGLKGIRENFMAPQKATRHPNPTSTHST